MAQSDLEGASLVCVVTLEWLNSQRSVLRKSNLKTATLRLMRNEFREIFIEIKNEKTNIKHNLKGITVHKKFMSEGKASINFNEENMILLISNAPPSQLLQFLRAMYVKLSGVTSGSKIGLRERLLSKKSQVVEEISPVTLQELSKVKAATCAARSNAITPPSSKIKRSLPSQNIQDVPPVKKQRVSTPLVPDALTNEQKEVLQAALRGRNIFFTGSAGTGKSYLLRRIIDALPPDVTFATASTGVAACHIGGTTLHSFAGIGSGEGTLERCIELASRPQVRQVWRKCRHLVIDEVSMVDGPFFAKLENVARVVRGCERPFGGLQLILCGDFLQLPPVTKSKDKVVFCFETPAWDQCIHTSFELNQVHRQSDPEFIDILQSVRVGRVTPEITAKLMETSNTVIEKAGILATRLCSHTQDAQLINTSKLNELSGEKKTFMAADSPSHLSKQLDQQTPIAGCIELKVGGQVMLMKNINISAGLVNGARGVVTRFSEKGLPVVRFCSKDEVVIHQEKWMVKAGSGNILIRKQIPLRLAWAFSIHKSQGLTLDCVEMSLGRVFEAGQAYVALSRAKSLASLRVVDFNPKQVWAHPQVLMFYKKFHRKLNALRIVPVKSVKSLRY